MLKILVISAFALFCKSSVMTANSTPRVPTTGDKSSDSYLSDTEVADALYGEWDADNEDMLSQTEVDSFGADDRGSFADIDAKHTGSRQEFDRRYKDSAVLGEWDSNRDGRLDRTEYDAVIQQYKLK